MPLTSPVLGHEQIASFFALEEVQAAKRKIDAQKLASASASVYFTVAMTETIRSILKESFNLDLPSATSVPMRWIKGDIAPHVDVGFGAAVTFDTTHLMYLTDSPGLLMLGGTSYPITKGAAYTFPESIRHETIHTGSEPRLLLGPMSEEGFAVGGPITTTIAGDGGSNVYIRQFEGSNEYSFDQINWLLFNTPTTVINTDPSAGILTVELLSDFDLINDSDYFICGSSHIQFGSSSLKEDGSRPIITIDGVTGYPGLIQNGTETNDGNSNINVYNLVVDVSNGSTLVGNGGWLGQEYFGRDASDNYIINCSSTGPISNESGGIAGRRAGSGAGASLTIIGCSSSGEIDNEAGGIAGRLAGENGGSIRCESCWSTGFIGTEGGGITGEDTENATILNCYSTGEIDNESGGICGQDCENSTITGCYSTGLIGAQAGGIVGEYASGVTITNCYSLGSIGSDAGGIIGPTEGTNTITNCYTAGTVTDDLGYIIGDSTEIPLTCFSEAFTNAPGGTWNSANADTALITIFTWVPSIVNQPYELFNMGYTPYTIANIDISGSPMLKRRVSSSLTAGSSTAGAIVTDKAYTILAISDGGMSSITIDATTGVISTTGSTAPGIYTIYLRNTGSYNITEYELTVTEGGGGTVATIVPCCARPTFRRGPLIDNTTYIDLVAGNTYIGSVRRNGVNISYAQIMAMKKAKASKTQ